MTRWRTSSTLATLLALACQSQAKPQAAPAPVALPASSAAEDAASTPPPAAPSPAAAAPAPASVLAAESTTPAEKSPRLGQEELHARFAVFPRAVTDIIPMGEQTVAHGVPMSIAFFETPADAAEVLTFYAQHFTRRGWSRFGTKDTRNWVEYPSITATDPEDLTQMAVMVMSGGKDATNTVILSIADARPEARVPEEGELPSYPGTNPLRVRTSEVGYLTFSVSFTTPDPVAKVLAFHRQRMKELGWEEQAAEPDEGNPRLELAFGKGDRRWRVGISRQKDVTLVTAMSTTQEVESHEAE